MSKDLIIGYGEIGQAVHEVICPDAIIKDITMKGKRVANQIEVMHICFPPSDKFVEQVWDYIVRYEPKYVAIWSTVPIGTTKKIGKRVIHTPIEGVHPLLAKSIKNMTRWVGYNNKTSAKFFEEYFKERKLNVKLVPNTDCTEALKLLSTTEYGINIEFARYKKKVADAIGMDFELTKEWNQSYNQLYKELGLARKFQKFVLDPPEGKLGGHCILPNYRILKEQFPDEILNVLGRY